MNTIKTQIKDIAQIVTGKTPPTEVKDYFGGKYPFITPSDISTYYERRLNAVERYLSDKGYNYQKKLLIPGNTPCFVAIGSTIGKMCLSSEESFTNQQIHSLISKKKKVHSYYLFYHLRYISPWIKSIADARGTGKAIINKSDFEKIEINLPPLPVQEKIAAILSAYDDLMENNNRRIAILEKMAEEIYREWFVRMRFPGHEQVKFHKGLPEEWEVINLPKICNKVTDGTHDTPKPSNDGFYLVTGKHIKENFIDFSEAYYISSEDHFNISKRSKLDKGDIILSNIGSIGSIAIVDQDFEFSAKNVIIIKPLNYKYTIFLYFLFNSTSTQEQFKQESSGTSQKFLGLSYVRNFKLLLPSKNLIENFAEITSPILREREKLYKVNQKLKISRDLLLPRLISGKLSVENLDINVPPHMEESDA